MMGFQHSRTRHVPDLLELRARIADHLGNRAEAAKIGLSLVRPRLPRIRCHIDQKTDFWERHFDFLEQLCAETVESRLGVNRHGFELDAVSLRAFVADDIGAGDQCSHHRFGSRRAHVRAFTLLGFVDDCPGTAIPVANGSGSYHEYVAYRWSSLSQQP